MGAYPAACSLGYVERSYFAMCKINGPQKHFNIFNKTICVNKVFIGGSVKTTTYKNNFSKVVG